MSPRKRTPSLDPAQLGFTFEPPKPATSAAELAGFDRFIAAGVGQALKEDSRSRFEIARAMSELLDEDVSKWMLDAYASEARENHNVSVDRFLALIAVTDRFDILDAAVRRIGAALLVGDEIKIARAGHLRARIKRDQDELRQVERGMQPIGRIDGGEG